MDDDHFDPLSIYDSESDDEVDQTSRPLLLSPLARSVLLFLMLWQFLFSISDAALSVIIVFVHHLLKSIKSLVQNDFLTELIDTLPLTLYGVHKEILGNDIKFNEYVVCPKCHSLYDLDACVITTGSNKSSRTCEYIEFPQHPQRSFRQPCGTTLLRTIRRQSKVTFKPFKVYCYQSLRNATARLLKRPGFADSCEHWRHRSSGSDFLGDIYDGQIWHNFHSFLSTKHSWCVALNVDWFQPFSHICDSVGALYLVILNLPRQLRYKKENMILVGIIPGPSEPSLNINSYLTPLVMELKEFYEGISVHCAAKNSKLMNIHLRLALVGIMCDLPASRKVCGFCSFNSLNGCNKCLKQFPTANFGESPDYSGYDTSLWPVRDLLIHKQKSIEHLNAKTKSYQKIIEKSYGIRYSILTELPYFDPIKNTVIDPMHNLFLGTAKHCLDLWIKRDILSKGDIDEIEKKMLQIHAPHSVGRIPLKIGSGFSGFTADQWRNWTLGFSPIVLRGVLPREHLQYWLLFVKGCNLLCSRCLLKENVELAHNYFQMFCTQFLQVNGPEACTPNMHLHLHLKECLYDYGPPYAFWCYAFERYNGMLGSFPTNKKSIEPQLMKKCLILQELHSQAFPKEGHCFESLILQQSSSLHGGLLMSMTEGDVNELAKLSAPLLSEELDFSTKGCEKCLPPITQVVLDNEQCSLLKKSYELLYPRLEINTLQRFVKKSARVSFGEEVFGSKKASRDSNITVSAYWPTFSEATNSDRNFSCLSIGEIQYFISHKVTFSGNQVKNEHIFAYVHWYKKHEHHNWFGSSAVVCHPWAENESLAFIPIQRISSLCIYGIIDVSFIDQQKESVLVAVPIHRKHHF